MPDNIEYEYRFANIDTNEMRKKLKKLGFIVVNPKRIMPIISFTHPTNKKNSYIRIRNEGQQITMTVKPNITAKFPTEYEVNIDNFEQGRLLLLSLGCKEKYKVEKLRETWNMPGNEKINEIVFDSYPGLAEYMEIDCKDLQTLHKLCKLLDLDYENYKEITLHNMYFEQYGFHLNKLPKMKTFDFTDTYKNINKHIKKNKNVFKKLFDEQRKYYID